MWEDLAGRVIAFTLGTLLSSVVGAAIWIRLLMRTNMEQMKIQKQTLELSAEQLAVTKVLNKEQIREKADEIDQTQRLVRARKAGD